MSTYPTDHLDKYGYEDHDLDHDLIREEAREQGFLEHDSVTFTINDLGAASWASRILRANAREEARLEAYRKAEIARINHIVDERKKGITSSTEYLSGLLHLYLKGEIDSGNIRTKSMQLPGGTISLRTGRGRITIEDEEAVINALEAADETAPIKIEKSILKKELGKVTTARGATLILDETGEPLQGAIAEPAGESFGFKPADDEES